MSLDFITSEFQRSRDVFDRILAAPGFAENIITIADACTASLRDHKKIMFCGNGGSAADSQHLAAELVSKLNYDRPGLNAIALTVDTSILTAVGNDYGYLKSFSRQVEAMGQPGDVLFVFSTSGRSKNVIEAVHAAKARGILTVGFLGEDGRDIGALVDHQINIPSGETPKIQEGHIATGHVICGLIEEHIFGAQYNPKRR